MKQPLQYLLIQNWWSCYATSATVTCYFSVSKNSLAHNVQPFLISTFKFLTKCNRKIFCLNQWTLVSNLKSNSEYHSIAFSSLVLYFQLVSITGYCDIKQVFIHPSILQKLYYIGFIPTEAKLISICHNESVKTYMYVKLYYIHPSSSNYYHYSGCLPVKYHSTVFVLSYAGHWFTFLF